MGCFAILNKGKKNEIRIDVSKDYKLLDDHIFNTYQDYFTPKNLGTQENIDKSVTPRSVSEPTFFDAYDKGNLDGLIAKDAQGNEGVIRVYKNGSVSFRSKGKPTQVLGKIDDIFADTFEEHGIFPASIIPKGNSTFKIGEDVYVSRYSDPTDAINRDANGNIVSVDLEKVVTIGGYGGAESTTTYTPTTITGIHAERIALDLHLEKINKNNDNEKFEKFLEKAFEQEDEQNNGKVQQSAGERPAKAPGKVQQREGTRQKEIKKITEEKRQASEQKEKDKYKDGTLPKVTKTKSFKTNEGAFDVYDVSANVPHRGDMFTVEKNPDGWIVIDANIPDYMQRRGVATEFYKRMNKASLNQTGKPLQSSAEENKNSKALWESFVKSGDAIQIDSGYRFKTKEENNPTAPKIKYERANRKPQQAKKTKYEKLSPEQREKAKNKIINERTEKINKRREEINKVPSIREIKSVLRADTNLTWETDAAIALMDMKFASTVIYEVMMIPWERLKRMTKRGFVSRIIPQNPKHNISGELMLRSGFFVKFEDTNIHSVKVLAEEVAGKLQDASKKAFEEVDDAMAMENLVRELLKDNNTSHDIAKSLYKIHKDKFKDLSQDENREDELLRKQLDVASEISDEYAEILINEEIADKFFDLWTDSGFDENEIAEIIRESKIQNLKEQEDAMLAKAEMEEMPNSAGEEWIDITQQEYENSDEYMQELLGKTPQAQETEKKAEVLEVKKSEVDEIDDIFNKIISEVGDVGEQKSQKEVPQGKEITNASQITDDTVVANISRQIFPTLKKNGFTLIWHSKESFQAKFGTGTWGVKQGKTIHVRSDAQGNTTLHEIFHPVISDVIWTDIPLRNKLIADLVNSKNPNIAAARNFAMEYQSKERLEEGLTEALANTALDAMLEYATKSPNAFTKLIRGLMAKMGLNQKSINDLISGKDSLESIGRALGEAFAKGITIKINAKNNKDLKRQIIGERGASNLDKAEEATIRLDNLAIAREMEAAKNDPKTIKFATGWERGADKKWRYEVPDFQLRKGVNKALFNEAVEAKKTIKELNKKQDFDTDRGNLITSVRKLFDELGYSLFNKEYARIIDKALEKNNADLLPPVRLTQAIINWSKIRDNGKAKLVDIISDDALFKAYPMLKDINVSFENTGDSKAYYDLRAKHIAISTLLPGNEYGVKSSLLHEIQHAIQFEEEFAIGGNPEIFAKELKELDKKITDYNEKMSEASKNRDLKLYDKLMEEKLALVPRINKLRGVYGAKVGIYDEYKAIAGEVESRNVQTRMDYTPEQRKQTLLKDTEDVAREDQVFLKDGVERALSLAAWHGSPHNFKKFLTEKIGTGEGAQTFGWGLYFTDMQGVAKFYAEKLRPDASLENQTINNIAKEELDSFKGDRVAAIKSLENTLKESWSDKKRVNKALQVLRSGKELPVKKSNVYKVTINKEKTPDQYTWLEWDKPVSDLDRKKINSQFEKEDLPKVIEDKDLTKTSKLIGGKKTYSFYRPNPITGVAKDFYEDLVLYFINSNIKNPQKEASLFLLRAGIDGIKYPAESISRGRTSDTARGFNYVVFDENAVTIEDKLQFQKETKNPNAIAPINKQIHTSQHTNVQTLTHNKHYKAAKSGDAIAAIKLVEELFKADKAEFLKRDKNIEIVPIRAIEESGVNAIPLAMGIYIEKIFGNRVNSTIFVDNKPRHTNSNALHRLLNPVEFMGAVEKGKKYFIVDDVTTTGSTINELKRHIEDNGGFVVGVNVMAASTGGTRFVSNKLDRDILNAKIPELDKFLITSGINKYGIKGLTRQQIKYLKKFNDISSIREKAFNQYVEEARADYERVSYRKSGETAEGVSYLSEADSDYGTGTDNLQRKSDTSKGDFTTVRGVWKEFKEIQFSGKVKVENAEDVAQIMSLLETKSVEHAFVVHIDKKGNSHIQFLSIGGTTGTVVDVNLIAAGVAKFNSKKIYLVHNHPSGAMQTSTQDVNLTQRVIQALSPMSIDVEHVIMDTYKHTYLHLDINMNSEIYTRGIKKDNYELKTMALTDMELLSNPIGKITQSSDVFGMIQQFRFSALPKLGVLILDRANNVIANYMLPNGVDYKQIMGYVGDTGIGRALIFYGNNRENLKSINDLKNNFYQAEISVLDYVTVSSNGEDIVGYYESAADQGVLRDVQEKYKTNSIKEESEEIGGDVKFQKETKKDKEVELLAPNGKKSNLNETQWKIVRTDAFQNWFGDWQNDPQNASKIVDENGEPLPTYHGSQSDWQFNENEKTKSIEFRKDTIGMSHDRGYYGRGFYFTFNTDPKWQRAAIGEASYYGENVRSYFINARKPFDINTLSVYKGQDIRSMDHEPMVFLLNIAKKFPEIAKEIKLTKRGKYDRMDDSYELSTVDISILPELFDKYDKNLIVEATYDNGIKSKYFAYDKTKTTKESYTDANGKYHEWDSMDDFGRWDIETNEEVVKLYAIIEAIERYEGITTDYHPEGYMTRYSEISESIKKDHDAILQSQYGDELVVFEPNQIKLADGTNTAFDPETNDIRYQREVPQDRERQIQVNGEMITVKPVNVDVVDGFYSPLEQIIFESKSDKLPVKQWIEKFGRGEEAKWTGLTEWLNSQTGSISKQDILNYLKNNRVEIVEVVKSDDLPKKKFASPEEIAPKKERVEWLRDNMSEVGRKYGYDSKEYEDISNEFQDTKDWLKENAPGWGMAEGSSISPTKFSQWQVKGEKENYKEILVTLPEKPYFSNDVSYIKVNGEWYGSESAKVKLGINNIRNLSTGDKVNGHFIDGTKQVNRETNNNFKSSHFDEPNILVHLRMNTRIDSEGKKVLFLEEIQSDWGQTGKKEGFNIGIQDKSKWRAEYIGKFEDYYNKYKIYDANGNLIKEAISNPELSVEQVIDENYSAFPKGRSEATPSAPFVTDTNSWTKLGLKVALKEAVKQGVDKIAWTTGEQQNDRYDLSKQLNSISVTKVDGKYSVFGYDKNDNKVIVEESKKESELEVLVGKELANKIILDTQKTDSKVYSGIDLKVGGKGMIGFYGSPSENKLGIVGNVVKSLFKQEPKTIKINTTIPMSKEANKVFEDDGWTTGVNESALQTQHSIDITPELRAEVERGLPKFQREQGERQKLLETTKKYTNGKSEEVIKQVAQKIKDKYGYDFTNELLGIPEEIPTQDDFRLTGEDFGEITNQYLQRLVHPDNEAPRDLVEYVKSLAGKQRKSLTKESMVYMSNRVVDNVVSMQDVKNAFNMLKASLGQSFLADGINGWEFMALRLLAKRAGTLGFKKLAGDIELYLSNVAKTSGALVWSLRVFEDQDTYVHIRASRLLADRNEIFNKTNEITGKTNLEEIREFIQKYKPSDQSIDEFGIALKAAFDNNTNVITPENKRITKTKAKAEKAYSNYKRLLKESRGNLGVFGNPKLFEAAVELMKYAYYSARGSVEDAIARYNKEAAKDNLTITAEDILSSPEFSTFKNEYDKELQDERMKAITRLANRILNPEERVTRAESKLAAALKKAKQKRTPGKTSKSIHDDIVANEISIQELLEAKEIVADSLELEGAEKMKVLNEIDSIIENITGKSIGKAKLRADIVSGAKNLNTTIAKLAEDRLKSDDVKKSLLEDIIETTGLSEEAANKYVEIYNKVFDDILADEVAKKAQAELDKLYANDVNVAEAKVDELKAKADDIRAKTLKTDKDLADLTQTNKDIQKYERLLETAKKKAKTILDKENKRLQTEADKKDKKIKGILKRTPTVTRLINIVKEGVLSDDTLANELSEWYGLVPLTDDEKAQLEKLMLDYQTQKREFDKNKAMLALLNYIDTLSKKAPFPERFLAIFQEYAYANMLNSPNSTFAALGGNVVVFLTKHIAPDIMIAIKDTLFGVLVPKRFKQLRKVIMNDPKAMQIWLDGMQDGLNELIMSFESLKEVMATGESSHVIFDTDARRLRAEKHGSKWVTKNLKRAIALLKSNNKADQIKGLGLSVVFGGLAAMYITSRGLIAADIASKSFIIPYLRNRNAYYALLKAGYNGNSVELLKNINELVGKNSSLNDAVEEDAAESGLTGKALANFKRRRYYELMPEFAAKEINAASTKMAEEMAMQGEVYGGVGKYINQLISWKANAMTSHSMLKKAGAIGLTVLFPFARVAGIGFNILKSATLFNLFQLPRDEKGEFSLSRGMFGFLPAKFRTEQRTWSSPGVLKETRELTDYEKISNTLYAVMPTVIAGSLLGMLLGSNSDDDDDDEMTFKIGSSEYRITGGQIPFGKQQTLNGYDSYAIQKRKGDTWITLYKYENNPMGIVFAPIGALSDEILTNPEMDDNVNLWDMLPMMMVGAGEFVADYGWASSYNSLKDLIDGIKGIFSDNKAKENYKLAKSQTNIARMLAPGGSMGGYLEKLAVRSGAKTAKQANGEKFLKVNVEPMISPLSGNIYFSWLFNKERFDAYGQPYVPDINNELILDAVVNENPFYPQKDKRPEYVRELQRFERANAIRINYPNKANYRKIKMLDVNGNEVGEKNVWVVENIPLESQRNITRETALNVRKISELNIGVLKAASNADQMKAIQETIMEQAKSHAWAEEFLSNIQGDPLWNIPKYQYFHRAETLGLKVNTADQGSYPTIEQGYFDSDAIIDLLRDNNLKYEDGKIKRVDWQKK